MAKWEHCVDLYSLKVYNNETEAIVLYSSKAAQKINASATLLNTGNFVLSQMNTDGTVNTLWQSFDHPNYMLLPGMRLGFNRGNRAELDTNIMDRLKHTCSSDNPSHVSGCVAQRFTTCRNQDTYVSMTNFKYGNMSQEGYKNEELEKLSLYDCGVKCLNSCSCFAYSSTTEDNTGCQMWIEEPNLPHLLVGDQFTSSLKISLRMALPYMEILK
ncbi:PAN/Apple domain, partial [Sesbania bispinosa]